MGGSWERLAHVELGSTGDTLSSGTFTAKDNLMVQINTLDNGNQNPKMQFNGDTGTNYSYRYSSNGGSDSTQTGQTGIYHFADDNGDKVIFCNISNKLNKEKLIISSSAFSVTGAGNYPNWVENVAKWANTSAQITSISCGNEFAGDFAAGSYITVWGASDDVVNDTTQNSTIFEENDTGKHQIWNSTTSAWVEVG
jgi:hypothetical protein